MYESEETIKKRISERLKNAPKFYLYCSACGKYLCCGTQFTKYLIHWDCRNAEIKYYNLPDNPAPDEETPRH